MSPLACCPLTNHLCHLLLLCLRNPRTTTTTTGTCTVADCMYDILHMDWRPNATKVAVLISDAPPHGLGEKDDGFPNGCPCNHDPLELARECAAQGITIYCVGCEPALSGYRHAKDFFIR